MYGDDLFVASESDIAAALKDIAASRMMSPGLVEQGGLANWLLLYPPGQAERAQHYLEMCPQRFAFLCATIMKL